MLVVVVVLVISAGSGGSAGSAGSAGSGSSGSSGSRSGSRSRSRSCILLRPIRVAHCENSITCMQRVKPTRTSVIIWNHRVSSPVVIITMIDNPSDEVSDNSGEQCPGSQQFDKDGAQCRGPQGKLQVERRFSWIIAD